MINELVAVSVIAILLLLLAAILGVIGFMLLTVGVVVMKLKQVR